MEELALSYVARFATTAAKLDAYLRRKLRERGWEGEVAADPADLVQRFVAAGYVDDAVYARMKQGSLLRRGYGLRRVGQALAAAGVGEDVRSDLHAGAGETRAAALAMVRKRRFGPYSRKALDPALREKQVAAMLRAGHPLDSARELVNAASVEAAEEWAAEAGEDDASGDDRCA